MKSTESKDGELRPCHCRDRRVAVYIGGVLEFGDSHSALPPRRPPAFPLITRRWVVSPFPGRKERVLEQLSRCPPPWLGASGARSASTSRSPAISGMRLAHH